jgi:hypothetical protein
MFSPKLISHGENFTRNQLINWTLAVFGKRIDVSCVATTVLNVFGQIRILFGIVKQLNKVCVIFSDLLELQLKRYNCLIFFVIVMILLDEATCQ